MSDKKIPTGKLYNACYGGYGISEKCVNEYKKRTGKVISTYFNDRSDPILIKLFFEKGSKWMSDYCAEIAFQEIPKSLFNYVGYTEYDGIESYGISLSVAYTKLGKIFLKSVKDNESNLVTEYHKFKNTIKKVEEYLSK